MKALPLLLAASLTANAALIVTFAVRPEPKAGATPVPTGSAPAAMQVERGAATGAEAAPTPQEMETVRAMRRLQAASAALGQASRTETSAYWRRDRGVPAAEVPPEINRLRREFSETARRALGFDPLAPVGVRPKFPFLPEDKQAKLAQILQDYGEMQATVTREAAKVPLSSDRAKLRLLREEQERDIAALLTPAEKEQYDLRVSRSAEIIRSRYGDAIASEEDYLKIFALQKEFDARFPMEDAVLLRSGDKELYKRQAEAERQLQERIQAALGEEKYAALRRASDPEYLTLTSLASRLGLPAATVDAAYGLRGTYAAESQRIQADASLGEKERRAQIQTMAERASRQIGTMLGDEAGDAYIMRAPWLGLLKGGMAFAINPKDAPPGANMAGGVYAVPPSGGRGGAAGGIKAEIEERASAGRPATPGR